MELLEALPRAGRVPGPPAHRAPGSRVPACSSASTAAAVAAAARLPRLPRARPARARRPHGLGRGAEGGLPAGRSLRDAARHDGVGGDRGGRLERARGPRPRRGARCARAPAARGAARAVRRRDGRATGFATWSRPTLRAYERSGSSGWGTSACRWPWPSPRRARTSWAWTSTRAWSRRSARGESHVEDVPRARCRAVAERFHASTRYADLAKVDAVVVAVPTPLTQNREPDLRPLIAAGTALAGVLQQGQLVVLESTTYPGTTRERFVPLLEESGLAAGPGLLRRLLARAHRPGPHRLHAAQHPQDRRRPDRRVPAAGRRAVRARLRRGRAGVHARGRRADASCSRTSSAR